MTKISLSKISQIIICLIPIFLITGPLLSDLALVITSLIFIYFSLKKKNGIIIIIIFLKFLFYFVHIYFSDQYFQNFHYIPYLVHCFILDLGYSYYAYCIF